MMHKKVIAIIPARGGSKGLKNKNIYPLNNKPLLHYSIEAALKSHYIDDIYVSSDSDKILSIASRLGINTIKRPDTLAQDLTQTEPVLKHVLQNIQSTYEYLVLLQPTSPLRDEYDIDAACNMLFNSEASSLISVYTPTHSPYKAFTCNKDGYLEGIINNTYPFQPRQELPLSYYPNGAIYIIKVDEFLNNNHLFTPSTLPYEMSAEKSIDIDSLEDILQAEKIIQGR